MKNLWGLRRDDFPKDGSLGDKVKFALGYAILAPSTHNSQPWRFKIEPDSCKIYYDKNSALPQGDPIGRDLHISMGCMIENLVVASKYFGIFADIKIQPEDNYIGEIFFKDGGEVDQDIEYLVDVIPKRVNARGIFKTAKIPGDIKEKLEGLNKNSSIKINFVTEGGVINNLASLTEEGLKIAHGSKSFRREMSSWMHNSLTGKKDGMPGYSLKMPFLLSFVIPKLVKYFDMSPFLAKLNYKSVASAPLICILSSPISDPLTWIEIGRLAERCMLDLQSRGIMTSIFVASIEMGDLNKKVQELVHIDTIPQFVFCAGYMGHTQRHSPRNDLDRLLV